MPLRVGAPGFAVGVDRAAQGQAAVALDDLPGDPLHAVHGQNDLREQTPDGVREPQNRRVEIVEGGPPGPVSMR